MITPKRINIIATTISGAISDWKKIAHIEEEFKKHTSSEVKLYIVESHSQAYQKAKELVEAGEKVVVSAGGAGTFNSVFEGCYEGGGVDNNFRLAFLRKGSADLLGKVLKIPDDLPMAAKIICESVEKNNVLEADIIEIKTNEEKHHILGFSGVGIFGDVPIFTEARFIKYYKGFLGQIFGDRGPFFVGVTLALLKYYLNKYTFRSRKYRVTVDGIDLPLKNYSSIIILNGDLGKHFPLAPGVPLNSGDFQLILIKDLGIFRSILQFRQAWTGNILNKPEKWGLTILRPKKLIITPLTSKEFIINVDGLISKTRGTVVFSIVDQVKLLSG